MTVERNLLVCDECDAQIAFDVATIRGAGLLGTQTGKFGQTQGWTRTSNGDDLCPECSSKSQVADQLVSDGSGRYARAR